MNEVVLICDGVTDNLPAIQAAINNRTSGTPQTVILDGYGTGDAMISAAIELPSSTKLIVASSAHIKLANNSLGTGDPSFITNSDVVNGNTDIEVVGGFWDGNCANQTITHAGSWVGGVGFRFVKVDRLRVRNITMRNQGTYAIWLPGCSNFTVEDIISTITSAHVNQDGVHVQGPASNFSIRNIQGNFNDDHVALNTDDGNTPTSGDITNGVIDTVVATSGYRGVRLHSGNGHVINNIVVRNILGSYSVDGVLLSYAGGTPAFQAISIDNVIGTFSRKPIYIETNVTGPLRITNSDPTNPIYINAGTVSSVSLNGMPYSNATSSTTWGAPFSRVGSINDKTNVAGRLSLDHATESYIELKINGTIIGYVDTSAGALNLIGWTGKAVDIYSDNSNPSNRMGHFDGTVSTGGLALSCPHSNQDIEFNSTGTGGLKGVGSLKIPAGTNARAGTFTLSSGTATIASTAVDSNSIIIPTLKTLSGTQGDFYKITPTAGTGFTITFYKADGTGVQTADNSDYNWALIRVA